MIQLNINNNDDNNNNNDTNDNNNRINSNKVKANAPTTGKYKFKVCTENAKSLHCMCSKLTINTAKRRVKIEYVFVLRVTLLTSMGFFLLTVLLIGPLQSSVYFY